MQNIYKTAQGKAIDVDKLRNTNEHVIAVGNMKVNARGDQLGPGGIVETPRNQVMDQHYKVYGTHTPAEADTVKATASATPDEPVIFPDDVTEQDQIEEQVATPPATGMRGSLASSVAPTTTVTQTLLKPPAKSSGPSRI